MEIKCIQGAGGNVDIDEEDCFPIPRDHPRVFHGSYVSCLQPMLCGPGILAGGRAGFLKRTRIYASAADYTLYPEDYVHEDRPFCDFRNEPYMPRSDCNMQVAISVPECFETGGDWVQTETLAMAGSLKWHAQPVCIEYAITHRGWLLYRRPPAIEPFSAFATQTAEGFSHLVSCDRCSRRNPRGLVYCFDCSAVLPGAVEENTFETRRLASERVEGRSDAGQASRGDHSDVGEIRRNVILKTRPVSRPSNPTERGVHKKVSHQTIEEQFTAYCKKHVKRIVMEKGCHLSDSDPPIVHYYDKMPVEGALVARCHDDPGYKRMIEAFVRTNFPEFIGLDQPFDDEFISYMTLQGLERWGNPLVLNMGKRRRRAMNLGQVQVYSERQPGTTAHDTAPLREHPNFHETYSSAQSSSSSRPAANKGRGKGKAQTRDQQWSDSQWRGWYDRGWDQWRR